MLTPPSIIADSQLNAGREMSEFFVMYLTIGLPISPALMSLGAVAVHLLDPDQLRRGQQARQTNQLQTDMFTAELADTRLTQQSKLTAKALQVMGRQAVEQQLQAVYKSPEFAKAVQASALEQAPELFRQAGINLDGADITLEEVILPQLGDKSGK